MTQNDTLHKVSDRPLSDMLVNLLDGSFEPKVHCDSVSTEGYSVNNLVSCNTRERCRGFLSAHFIRPPIVVLFQLPFPASVELLVIGPKVGSQMSTGIDIFFARTSWNVHEGSGFSQSGREGHRSSKGPKSKRRKMNEITRQLPATKCEGSDATVTVQKPLLHQYTDEITAASFKAEHANLFSQVARLSAQDGRTIGVIDPRSHEGKNKIPTGSTQERFRQCHLLRCITHLALRVHRVNSSGAVAIGKVELWGKPAPICGEEIVEYTHKIYRSLNQETSQCHLNSPIRGQNQHTIRHGRDEAGLKTVDRRVVQAVGTQQSSLGTKSATSDIPEEFMDAITCDIMTIPMLLPSGHNVDSSTLDKHCAVEETWGRVPSDPFTGIPFSEMHKAVPNSALKVRIDKFLLSSGLNVQGRGRTVGRGTRAVGKTQLVACAGEGTMTKCSNETAKQSWCSTGNTDSSLSESTESSATKYQSNPVAEVVGGLNHEDIVAQSLDMALQKTLGGLSTFSRKRAQPVQAKICVSTLAAEPHRTDMVNGSVPCSPAESFRGAVSRRNQPSAACVCCVKSLADQATFRLPCQHLICRTCITAKVSLSAGAMCDDCGRSFTRTTVVRAHTV